MNHPVSYQIRIRGRLGQTMRRAFPALHAETQGEDTLLAGALADQAALFGCWRGSRRSGSNWSKSGAANHPAV